MIGYVISSNACVDGYYHAAIVMIGIIMHCAIKKTLRDSDKGFSVTYFPRVEALMSADKSVSLNFGIPAAVLRADHFLFPSGVWERDGMSLLRHDMSLESLLCDFHEQRRDSYLSPESVQRSLGTTSQPRFPIPRVDKDRLVELATYGMIVSEPPGFQSCPSPPVFRRSSLEGCR